MDFWVVKYKWEVEQQWEGNAGENKKKKIGMKGEKKEKEKSKKRRKASFLKENISNESQTELNFIKI